MGKSMTEILKAAQMCQELDTLQREIDKKRMENRKKVIQFPRVKKTQQEEKYLPQEEHIYQPDK